ncbi:MAG: outer membrane beta-barrel protein [Bacteroidetes bacterium]|jgi:hypothetical protein|nr:outer membrane beta-barrel protein [Bacteroidota bacterium]
MQRSLAQAFRPCLTRALQLAGLSLLLIGIAGLLRPDAAQAQSLRWDVSAGVTSSALVGDPAPFARQGPVGNSLPVGFGRRTGGSLGVGLRAGLTPWLTARTAVRYAQRGGVIERELTGPADGPAEETITAQLDYLSLPLLAEVRAPRRVALGLRPFLYAGPALGLSVRSKEERAYQARRFDESTTRSVDTAATVVSVVTGAGVAYGLPHGGDLVLDLRYSYGLTDVAIAGHDTRVGTAQVGVQYVLP